MPSRIHPDSIAVKYGKITVQTIEDIVIEVRSYKWSRQIAEFNYDENFTILNRISTINLAELEVPNILYVTALIELLGPTCINCAIMLHKKGVKISNELMKQHIGKYIEWQTHTASSYTVTIRKAAKIIDAKYNGPKILP